MAAAVAAAVPPPAAYETNPLSCVLLFAHKLFSARGVFGGVDKRVMDDGCLVRRQGTLTLKLLWGRSAPKFFRTAELGLQTVW